MKKRHLIMITATAGVALGNTALAGGPIDGRIYGKLNTSLLEDRTRDNRITHLTNNYSYFGLKGKTELEDGLSALYQLEYQVAPDETAVASNSSAIFKQRDSYLGLGTPFGTLLAGSYSTPLRRVQGRIDQFNFLPLGDIKNLIDGELRVNNVTVYLSPTRYNTQVKLASQANESGQGSNGSSASISYDNNSLYLAAGMDRRMGDIGKKRNTTRLAAQYRLPALSLGAILNRSRRADGSTKAKNGWVMSSAYRLGKNTFKAQLGRSDEKSAGRKLAAIGIDHRLGTMTKLFTYYAGYHDDVHNRASVYGVGMEHKF